MENIGVDFKLLLAQLINFGLFIFLYSKFIAGPFSQIMKDEKKKDAERKRLAEEVEKQKELLASEEKSAREEIRRKTDESLKAVHQSAEKERAALLKKAQDDAAGVSTRAAKQLEDEKMKMEHEYKETVSKMSILTVEHALKDFLTEDMQKQVNARILSNLQKK
jgi:F0F1-type ATP synthase membrane subunit b/b'